MTKVIVRKITKKPAVDHALDESTRAKRFKELAVKFGADELEVMIDRAIRESDERRKRMRRQGAVTISVS